MLIIFNTVSEMTRFFSDCGQANHDLTRGCRGCALKRVCARDDLYFGNSPEALRPDAVKIPREE